MATDWNWDGTMHLKTVDGFQKLLEAGRSHGGFHHLEAPNSDLEGLLATLSLF